MILKEASNIDTQGTKTKRIVEVEEKSSYTFCKRAFDIFCSLFALIVLFVPIAIVSLIIIIDSPGASPFYTQTRVGKNGKEFKMYKLRSMVPNAELMLNALLSKNEMDGPAFKMEDDPRITRFGKIIRKCSIDELPQFLNVIKGDMSLVGPRPPLPREVALYDEQQMQRLSVVPGITCLWQVQPQRNTLSFDSWLELDLEYIENRSIKTDLIILFKTIGAVCGMEGT